MEPHRRMPQRVLLTARIIWGGLLFSPIVLGLVIWILFADRSAWPETVSFSEPLTLVLLFVALVVFLFSFKAEGVLSHSSNRPMDESEGQRELGLYVVKLALFEIPAIVGFSLAVVKGALVLFVPFFLLSISGFAVSYPDKDRW